MESDDLADAIYEGSRTRSFDEGRDELGIPISDDAYYLAKRAWMINVMSGAEANTIDRIHRRNNGLYIGNEKIEEDVKNAYRLTQYEGKIKPGMAAKFWEELKKLCPRLNTKYLQADDYTLYCQETGELVKIPEDPEEYRNFMANLEW